MASPGRRPQVGRRNWSSGRPASRRPDFLREIDGLETNRGNQLVVTPTLQTTRDDNVFAHRRLRFRARGSGKGGTSAARAGRAPAGLARFRAVIRRLDGKPLPYRYHDFGSLVSLGDFAPSAT